MTAADPFDAHPTAFEHTVLFDGLVCIDRACRFEPAGGWEQRRYEAFVKTQQLQRQKLHDYDPRPQRFGYRCMADDRSRPERLSNSSMIRTSST